MALIKFSKKPRPYILKRDRGPEFYDDLIKTAREELEKLETAPVEDDQQEQRKIEITSKKNEIEAIVAEKKHQLAILEKYGPTTWYLTSISRVDLHNTLARMKMALGSRKAMEEINTANVAALNLRAYAICKMGIKGWDNLRDDTNNFELVPFDKDAIEYIDEGSVFELSNEIQGGIAEEEAKNSEPPLSSSSGTEN